MTVQDRAALQIKNGECGRCQGSYLGCADCEFSCERTGKPCNKLTADEIFNIWESNTYKKEDKNMTKKEEIQQEIEKTQKQLAALQKKLKEAEDEVPETLDFGNDNSGFCVAITGEVKNITLEKRYDRDIKIIANHRAFKDWTSANIFADKSQFIADLLHFKYLYDRYYKPNWSNYNEPKWFVYYDHDAHMYYREQRRTVYDPANVCFSTEKIAQKCADWLNKRNKE